MAISVDVVISGKTTTSVEGKTTAAVITTNLQEDKLATKGGIISGAILPHQTDTVNLGSPSKRFLNLYAKSAHLAADSLHLGDEATISASAGGGFSFDTAGETVFGDIKVRNLTVTGAQSIISSTDLAVKDNIIIINSGEAGAGITLTSGGLVIDRGTLENATILFNDATDRFELNFPISVDGSELAVVPDLIATGQTLQGQITTNDADIATLTSNLSTVETNLVTTGQTLTSEVNTLSGLAVFHSMTGNFATHIKDLDDVTLAGNQGKYLKVNAAGDGISYDIPPVTGVGGEGGGAVKFTGLVDAPNDYSSILTEFPVNGGLVAVNSSSESLIYLNSGAFATDSDLIATGNTLDSQRDTLSGNLITTGTTLTNTIISTGNHLDSLRNSLSGDLISSGNTLDEKRDILSGNLITSGNTLDSKRDTLSGNLITTGQNLQDDIDTVSGNLISTGNNLQSQITSNDSDISTLQAATGEIQDIKFNKAGGTISGEVLPNASGTINLGSPSLPFRSGYFNDLIVSSDSIKIGEEATLSSPPAGGLKFDTTGTITFGDVSIKNLTVTGTRTVVESTDTALKDNIIILNSGEDGAGISLTSGGIVIDRGSATDANILFNDSTDQFEVNFPLAVEGSLAVKQNQTGIFAEAANLVTTGQTLQTQITSNDGDISTLTSNLASTGDTLTSNVSTLTSNLASTGSTLAADIVTVSGLTEGNDNDIATITSNLVTTGQTLTSEINTVSGLATSNDSDISTLTSNLVTTGQTLQTQITSNDSDISTLTSNVGTTGQTLQTQITSNDSDISTLTSNLATTGQTLQTQITNNDSDISTLTSNIASTGNTLGAKIDTLSGVVTLDSETGNLVDTSMTGNFAVNFLDLDDTPSDLGAVGQSVVVNAARDGLIFSGVSAGGGGGGSSTFVGLSDTPGALTASRLLAVNSAGNSIEFLESGALVTDSETGVFATSANLVTTGQTLTTNINTVSSNLVSTGSVIDDVSGNLITTGQTLQSQITSNDSDISTLTSNLVTTGQTLQTQITTLQGQTGDNLTEESLSGTYSTQFNVTAAGGAYSLSEITAGSHTTTSQVQKLEINLQRGNTYKFTTDSSTNGHPFIFVTQGNGGAYTHEYISGVTNSRAQNGGVLYFRVPQSAPSSLTYACGVHGNMGANVKIYDDTGNLIDNSVTGQFASDADITTLTSNLTTTGQTLTTNINTVASNLITTGQTLQTQITSNDGDITTLTSNLATTGQTLQTQITSNDSDISTLTSNLGTTGQTLTSEISTLSGLATLDSETGSLIDTSMTGDFADTTILESFTQGLNIGTSNNLASRKLHVVGDVEISGTIFQSGSVFEGGGGGGGGSSTFVGLSDTPGSFTANKYVRVNSAGNALEFTETVGGINSTDIFTGDGSVSGFLLTPTAVTSTKDLLVSLNGILQRPDTDYSIVGNTGLFFNTSVTSGYFVEARHIVGVSGAAGADGQVADLTASGFITTGNTGQFASDADVSSVSSNLVSTGSIVDDISGNLITTGQTLQTQITSNDSDISTLTSNLITTGQTLTSEISTLSGLVTLDSETGNLIDTSMTGDFANTTILESFAQGLNVGTSSNLTDRKLHVVGDIEISGTIYQSGSVFEGGGGGGGGSSTFVGLSDTPGSFTANKYLSVNSAGNAIEMVDTIQSGYQSVDQGYFTGLTLGGVATGILQNASGTISNLDLADNKFDVSVIEERDANVGDTNFDDVSLLLPFDGSDAATSTSDESDNSHTVTFGGTAQLDTAQKKFGSASLLLDGDSDYIQVADHDSFDFNAGDFTVECWIRFAALGNNTIFSHFANGTASSMSYYLTYFNSSNILRLGHYLGSNADTSYSWSPSTGTWYHIALVRNGTTLKVYIDGTSVISVSASTTALGASEDPFRVGVFNDASTGSPSLDWYFNGHIDDLRITKGLARYTSNFTAPSAAHRTSANIVENKYIGQIGGIDDSDVDYGIEKLSNSQLMIKKLSDNTFAPDRLYVNVNKLGALGKGIAFNKLYTGDGTTTNFAIPSAVDNVRDVLVSVEGLVQIPTTDYTLAGTTGVSFTTGVTSGHLVDIRHLALGPSGAAGAAGADGSAGDLSASGFITTGNTGQFASDADVSSVSSNLVSTGSIVDDISGNLITTGQTLTTNINTVSTNLITTGQTLQTQITSNDGDITTLTSNLVTTGQTLQTQITSNDSDITTLTSNLITTGQTLTSEISTLSGLATLDSETGSLIDTSMTGKFLATGADSTIVGTGINITGDLDVGRHIYVGSKLEHKGDPNTYLQFAPDNLDIYVGSQNMLSFDEDSSQDEVVVNENSSDIDFRCESENNTHMLLIDAANDRVGINQENPLRTLHVVGDVEISGTIYQSGSVFEGGGGGGGGGGSSTFVGLSDTPGSFTANKVLTVNSAGSAVETTFSTSVLSGHQSVEQGYFTGLTLGGTGTGILQNASGTISNLDLADNKFDVSVIEERDSAVGDSNFDKVELLLPFEGANDATSTTDESDSNHTVSFNGSADISTAQKKFGGSSLYLPGGSNDWVNIAGSSDFNFGTNDFTIELWMYRTSTAYGIIFETRGGEDTTSTDGITFYLGSGGNNELRVAINRSNVIDINQDHQTNNQWQHFAIVREGSTMTLYIDGTARGTGSNSTDFDRSRPIRIGNHHGSSNGGIGLQGYIDDFRVTKGLARYTSNFTPPSAAHPTSEGITENKYIGQIGGIDDTDVDYGIEKLSNSQLMIKKLSDNTFTPDRLYVNVNKLGALGHGIAFDQVYTGDGTTTNYLLSENVSNARDVLVSVEGLIQTPIIDYTLAGTTGVSFTTGVTSGDEISFRHLALGPSGAAGAAGADGASADISYLTERFTGNGVVSGFEMSRSISTADEIFVFVNGLMQDSGANFSVTAGTGLYFTDGEIVSGDKIMVRHIY